MTTPPPADHGRQLVAQAQGRRVLLGISGGPGSGKSTVAADLATQWRELDARVVPMDGFHLSNAQLKAASLAHLKGAPETFSADALARLLENLRGGGEAKAPAYSRELHEPVPGAIHIPATCRIVIVEGNYLGLAAEPWPRVRERLDWLWRLDVPWSVARERLIARRIATGRDPAEAEAWVDTVDAQNAALVATSGADAVLTCNRDGWVRATNSTQLRPASTSQSQERPNDRTGGLGSVGGDA